MSEQDTDIIIITQGENAEFDIFLEKKDSFPRPVDLTNFDKFRVCLEKIDGSFLDLTEVANANGSVVTQTGSPLLGQLKVTIDALDTANLRDGFGQDIDIEWDNAATPNPKRKRIHKALNVEQSNCP